MKKLLFLFVALGAAGAWFVTWWRRHPRFGSETVNRVVNPWLVERGIPEASRGEIGLIEHVGRKSGTVRVTPVHPVRTPDGFRIIVPLGGASQWASNVLAAGHCRLQAGDVVHELDEPRLVNPMEVAGLPALASRAMEWLGFRYLVLRQFAEHPGTLEAAGPLETGEPETPELEPEAREPETAPAALSS